MEVNKMTFKTNISTEAAADEVYPLLKLIGAFGVLNGRKRLLII